MPRRLTLHLVLALSLAALTGCQRDLAAPAGLRVEETSNFDLLRLSWSPGCGACAYELDSDMGGTTRMLTAAPLPPGTTAVHAAFQAPTPELLQIQFRIRAVVGSDRSPWSAPVTLQRRVRPPTIDRLDATELGDVQLAWTNRSAVADRLEVERLEPGGDQGATHLAAAFGDTTLVDRAAPELTFVTYRVRYGAGDTWSRPTEFTTLTPVRQPVGISAVVRPEGVLVTWTRRSTKASRQLLRCTFCAGPVELAPDASSWLDPNLPPWPSITYQVEAEAAGALTNSRPAPPAALAPFRLVGAVATLDARAGPFPDSLRRRDADGAWWEPWSLSAVRRHDAVGVTEHAITGQHLVGLVSDAAGDPHVVTLEDAGPGLHAIAHQWHDAGGWHRESTGPLPVSMELAWFGVDGAGEPQLAYLSEDGAGGFLLVHGVRGPGGFEWGAIPGVRGDFLASRFAVGADGWAHAVGYSGGYVLASRPPDGPWTVEPLPGPAWFLAPAANGDIAVYGRDAEHQLVYAERVGPAWSGAEVVAPGLAGGLAGLARSEAGDRTFMTIDVPDDGPGGKRTDLFSRGPGGWTSMRLAPWPGGVAIGFAPDGRLVLASAGAVWEEVR